MKRKNSDKQELEASTRSTRIVSGETEAPEEASGFKTSLDNEISDMHFRKAVHGYNIEDVTEYVGEQNKNFLTTCQMYDGKIAEMRAEIAFLNRERESLLSKLEEARINVQNAREEAEQAKQSEQMEKEECNAAREELEVLKAAIAEERAAAEAQAVTEALAQPVVAVQQPAAIAQPPVYIQQHVPEAQPVQQIVIQRERHDDEYNILIAEVALLRSEKAEAQSTLAQLAEIASGYEELSKQRDELSKRYQAQAKELEKKEQELARLLGTEGELRSVKGEENEIKQAFESEQKKRREIEEELKEKEGLMVRAVTELEQLRKEISEFEVRQSKLRQQLEKSDEEIAAMRAQNKRQAYDYAAKISDLETDFNSSKLAMQKQMQVHMYHIKQVDLLLNELQKQFGEAKGSLDEIEPKE